MHQSRGGQDELETLRDTIADVDRGLLELLRRRMELAARIGELKAATGAPVVARNVEDRVYTRARQHAEACGVSGEVMEAIFQAIVRGSVERQHRVGIAARARRGGRVLVVGGAGGMGSWFRTFLAEGGHQVDTVDPAWRALAAMPGRFASLEEAGDLDAYDHVLVSVPLAETPAVLAALAARNVRATVVEIASIKSHLAASLAAADRAGVDVVCLHPMFGPSKSLYEPLTFVLASRRADDAGRKRLEPLLRHPTTELVSLPFDRHDRLMGWLLGLAHLSGMLFGTALARAGLDGRELASCASTTFSRQAATALSVLSEDPGLYLDIQRLNPHRGEVYAAVRDAFEELVGLVDANDRQGFSAALAAARRTLDGPR